MNINRTFIAWTAMSLACSSGWALDNNVQTDFGTVSLPLQKTLSNVFVAQGTGLYLDQTGHGISDAGKAILNWTGSLAPVNFVDDFVFDVPGQGSLAAQVASIAWTNLLGIDSLNMRLYDATNGLGVMDVGNSVFATKTVLSSNSLTVATSFFDQPVTLQAGRRYAVEIAGRVVGTAGGNYSGSLVMTSTPAIPEPSSAWLGLASLAVIARLSRRWKNKT